MTVAAPSAPRSRGPIPVYPWLVALSPILSLYVTNHTEVPLADMVRPAVVVVAATALLWLIFYAVLRRDIHRSAVITSLTVFWVLAFGRVAGLSNSFLFDLLVVWLPDSRTVAAANRAVPVILAALWLVLLLVTTLPFVLARRFRDLSSLTSPLNITGVLLVAVPLSSILMMAVSSRTAPNAGAQANASSIMESGRAADDPAVSLAGQAPTPAAPDIYFIVLDAYGRQDELQRFYGFDNSRFVNALQERGFAVVPKARANYDQTALCLSAALDMGYLPLTMDDAPHATAPPSGDFDDAGVNHAVDQSVVADVARRHGYRVVTITCEDWLIHKLSPDLNLGSRRPAAESLTPFEGLLENLTPLALLPRAETSQYDEHRDELDDGWRNLAEVAQHQPERKFVFAHLLAPHPPFVYGRNGDPVRPPAVAGRVPLFSLSDGSDYLRSQSHETYRRGYTDQLQYVNTRTLAAVDAIRAASKTPPIIIVLGDHGSRQFLDWDSLQHTELREVFSNLQAYYLPDGAAASVYGPSVSPVNSFRLLYNHLFGTRDARLPDRSYYSTKDAPFRFTDVTDRSTL